METLPTCIFSLVHRRGCSWQLWVLSSLVYTLVLLASSLVNAIVPSLAPRSYFFDCKVMEWGQGGAAAAAGATRGQFAVPPKKGTCDNLGWVWFLATASAPLRLVEESEDFSPLYRDFWKQRFQVTRKRLDSARDSIDSEDDGLDCHR